MLVALQNLIQVARGASYALGAFNTYNMEITQAIVRAAEELKAPVIIQTGSAALQGEAAVALPALALALARSASVPVAVHLDHAADLDLIDRALALGYSSIMIDGSARSLDANIELTREAVQRGHEAGVAVEAELGGLCGNEDNAAASSADPAVFTHPTAAARFVAATEVDLLAVSIGNVHGYYRGAPRLDLGLLDELRDRVPVPLVLHGASGLPDDAIRQAIERGITKINFNTELRAALFAALGQHLEEAQPGLDVSRLMRSQIETIESVVREKLLLLGSAGRAAETQTVPRP